MNIDETIRSVQAALGLTVDGKPGPQTVPSPATSAAPAASPG